MKAIYLAALGMMFHVSSHASDTDIINKLWQVKSAHINLESGRTMAYQKDDPRLVGRFLQFTDEHISSDLPGAVDCKRPTFTTEKLTVDNWLQKATGITESTTAQSYHLPTKGDAKVLVRLTQCKSGSFDGGGFGDNGAVIAQLAADRMLVSWGEATVIELQPVDKQAIKPSFNCANAGNSSEKAICADYRLASLDKSVLLAWNGIKSLAKEVNNKALMTDAVSSQKVWLSQRNQCGEDAACLSKSMSERMDVLLAMPDKY